MLDCGSSASASASRGCPMSARESRFIIAFGKHAAGGPGWREAGGREVLVREVGGGGRCSGGEERRERAACARAHSVTTRACPRSRPTATRRSRDRRRRAVRPGSGIRRRYRPRPAGGKTLEPIARDHAGPHVGAAGGDRNALERAESLPALLTKVQLDLASQPLGKPIGSKTNGKEGKACARDRSRYAHYATRAVEHGRGVAL